MACSLGAAPSLSRFGGVTAQAGALHVVPSPGIAPGRPVTSLRSQRSVSTFPPRGQGVACEGFAPSRPLGHYGLNVARLLLRQQAKLAESVGIEPT